MAFPIRESCSYTVFLNKGIDLIKYSIVYLNRQRGGMSSAYETWNGLALIGPSH